MTTGQAGQVEAMSYQCGGSFNKLEQVPALPPSKIIKKSSSSTSLYKCMQMWLWVKNKGLERLALCISQPQGGQNQVLRKTWSLLLIRNSDSESTFSTTLLRVVKYPYFDDSPEFVFLTKYSNAGNHQNVSFSRLLQGGLLFWNNFFNSKKFQNMPYLPFWNWTLVGWICCQT